MPLKATLVPLQPPSVALGLQLIVTCERQPCGTLPPPGPLMRAFPFASLSMSEHSGHRQVVASPSVGGLPCDAANHSVPQ